MRAKILCVCILALLPVSIAHAQKRAFTIEDFYRIQTISDISISPDGRSAVYVVASSDLPRARRVTHIWMMDVDGNNARQLTFNARGESSPRFSPDGKSLSFISSRDGQPN